MPESKIINKISSNIAQANPEKNDNRKHYYLGGIHLERPRNIILERHPDIEVGRTNKNPHREIAVLTNQRVRL